MTIKELIAILETLPEDLPILMSKDGEGNGYRKLSEYGVSYENNAYNDDDENDIEVGLLKLDAESIEAGYDEEDVLEGGSPCVILYPN